jgi:hypothetical protein
VLEGRNVNLRVMEKEDIDLLYEFWNDLECRDKDLELSRIRSQT